MRKGPTVLERGLDGFLRLYQLSFSAVFGRQCRYYPTCSDYARQAVRMHGAGRGLLLAGLRVCRCGPQPRWLGGGHGFDPVPQVWHDAVTRFTCTEFLPKAAAVPRMGRKKPTRNR